MGTRHLTSVIYKNKVRVAQYGQWDGYPDKNGQGETIADFIINCDLGKFKDQLDKYVRFKTDEDQKELDEFFKSIGVMGEWMDGDQVDKFKEKYPHLSRDTGAGVLHIIYNTEQPLFLGDSSDFASDGLFCEWAYVIDLDNENLEIYQGFHKTRLNKPNRFAPVEPSDMGYIEVQPWKEFTFNELRVFGMEMYMSEVEKLLALEEE